MTIGRAEGGLEPSGRLGTVVDALEDKLAEDVVMLEVADVLAIADWFVIASAPNHRQVRRLAEEVELKMKELHGESPLRSEGTDDYRWVLLDYGDIIVHVFLSEAREHYALERLWSDVPSLRP